MPLAAVRDTQRNILRHNIISKNDSTRNKQKARSGTHISAQAFEEVKMRIFTENVLRIRRCSSLLEMNEYPGYGNIRRLSRFALSTIMI